MNTTTTTTQRDSRTRHLWGGMPRNASFKQGFTFVETLVAITVLLVAIAAPMSLAQNGIMAARLSQDQIVAFYLAQEGIEITRNLRDNNRLQNASEQLAGSELQDCIVADPDSADLGCMVDATQALGSRTERCSGECEAVRISNVAPYVYSHRDLGYSETKYIREVKVWYPDGDVNEAIVEATVTWPFGANGVIESYKIRDYLYNW